MIFFLRFDSFKDFFGAAARGGSGLKINDRRIPILLSSREMRFFLTDLKFQLDDVIFRKIGVLVNGNEARKSFISSTSSGSAILESSQPQSIRIIQKS